MPPSARGPTKPQWLCVCSIAISVRLLYRCSIIRNASSADASTECIHCNSEKAESLNGLDSLSELACGTKKTESAATVDGHVDPCSVDDAAQYLSTFIFSFPTLTPNTLYSDCRLFPDLQARLPRRSILADNFFHNAPYPINELIQRVVLFYPFSTFVTHSVS
jgi:hypothetical protein